MRRRLCRANLKDVLRGRSLWPSILDAAGRWQRYLSARRGAGLDARSTVAVGDAMGGAVGNAYEFQSLAHGVQSGVELGAGYRNDRASRAGDGTGRGAVHEAVKGDVAQTSRRRSVSDRSGWQVSADRDRGGTRQASRETEA